MSKAALECCTGLLARAVHFLIESPAITGTTLLVDGGQHFTPVGRDVQFLVSPFGAKNP